MLEIFRFERSGKNKLRSMKQANKISKKEKVIIRTKIYVKNPKQGKNHDRQDDKRDFTMRQIVTTTARKTLSKPHTRLQPVLSLTTLSHKIFRTSQVSLNSGTPLNLIKENTSIIFIMINYFVTK